MSKHKRKKMPPRYPMREITRDLAERAMRKAVLLKHLRLVAETPGEITLDMPTPYGASVREMVLELTKEE